MTYSSRNSSQWSDRLHRRNQSMHRRHNNMDDRKSAQTLNGKTEALLFPFSSSLKPSTVSLPDSITLGSHKIPFSDSAKNLGFILDSNLSMKKHVIKICLAAYFELKHISSIRRVLSEDAAKTLPTSYILALTAWLLQLSQSSWVHLILSSNLCRKFKTLLQDSFSWHPATTTQHLSWKKNWIGFPFQNVLSIKYFNAVNGSGPAYLSELLLVYTPSRTLRYSSETRMLDKRKTHCVRNFSCFGPHIWNSFPQDLRHCSTLLSF